MKRTRRHKYLQISVFFLIYSIIQVLSIGNKENETTTTEKSDSEAHAHLLGLMHSHAGHSSVGKATEATTTSTTTTESNAAHEHLFSMLHSHAGHSSVGNKVKSTPNTAVHEHIIMNMLHAHGHSIIGNKNNTNSSAKVVPAVVGHEFQEVLPNGTTTEKPTTNKPSSNDTDDCTPPAIKQFPHPIMSPGARRHGGLIIHIIVAVYMFLGLAIVCDEYFVASLDRICEELKMAPDVAGATFMAAGSSAPELATVIIGVFLAKDDIGISGVIGSAVFNIMFVIACCGLCSSAVVYLNWWPLVRDSFFYAISILVMLVVIFDKKISWLESLVMILTYLVYCVVLHFNTPLERWAQTWPVPFKKMSPTEQSGLVSYKTLEDGGKHQSYGMEQTNAAQGYGVEQTQQFQQPPDYSDPGMNNFGMAWSPEKYQDSFASQLSGPELNQASQPEPTAPPPAVPEPVRPVQPDYYRPKEYDPAAHVDPLVRPEGGWYQQASWGLIFPIHWLCRKTMPDCRSEKYRNWYPFTFFVSMVWISFYSYFMVWMITIIGYTLGIPDTVMGLTFVAAGVSVPDALSSVAVIKEGYGDMAVSNAVGSNVFDILICLGLPWFIKTAIIRPGSTVRVLSKGLTYSTLSLLSTVVFLVVATHMNGWKLDRRFGIMLMVWYLVFITFASMYELNVFGYMNPPECSCDW
ncbi:probable sodium/potassium/calcium exchanger CG1090 [Diabrotica virgifera virgifera]|uniref:Probable sodium/potassium/calcium exchanger CG1090 n=1 Tax=Diabrotica virgifera virgifera TaxID=50390 RepID=A0A6P7F8S4_DIAVI|nr:probable sodium/potassium/calcium exchanger CG1090 [Diabrotica virgifera virgifera]